MWEYLALPEHFKIKKKNNLQTFLKNPNLTKKEKERIINNVRSLTLCYDLTFSDSSEIIVIDVLVNSFLDKWEPKALAKIISESLPYNCIVYFHAGRKGALSLCLTRKNTVNSNRLKTITQSVSPEFLIVNPSNDDKVFLMEIGNILNESMLSAEIAMEECRKIIERHKDKKYEASKELYRKKEELRLINLKYCRKEKPEEKPIISHYGININYDDFEDEYYNDSDFDKYSHISNKIYNEESYKLSHLTTLSKSAYTLFEIYCDSIDKDPNTLDDFFKDDWLEEFIEMCEEIINEIYHIPMDWEYEETIIKEFRNQTRILSYNFQFNPIIDEILIRFEKMSEDKYDIS